MQRSPSALLGVVDAARYSAKRILGLNYSLALVPGGGKRTGFVLFINCDNYSFLYFEL